MEPTLSIRDSILIQVALLVGFLTLMPAKEVVVMEGVDYTASAAFCNVGTWGGPAIEDTLDVVSATYGGSGAAPRPEYRWVSTYNGTGTDTLWLEVEWHMNTDGGSWWWWSYPTEARAVGEREEP